MWPEIIIIKISKYLSFYDFVSVSLLNRQFYNTLNLEEAELCLPFTAIKRKYIRSLTDYIMFQYLQNPSRLDNITLTSMEKIIKKGINVENSIRIYLRSFMILKLKYKFCLEWKKYQIWLRYPYFSQDLLDGLYENIEQNYTWKDFLYEQRRTTEFFLLKDKEFTFRHIY